MEAIIAAVDPFRLFPPDGSLGSLHGPSDGVQYPLHLGQAEDHPVFLEAVKIVEGLLINALVLLVIYSIHPSSAFPTGGQGWIGGPFVPR